MRLLRARIERKLNKLDGVVASVNYATEQASVSFDPDRAAVDDLLRTVEAAGYHASLEARRDAEDSYAREPRTRLAAAAALTAPLVVLAMVPPLQFDGWEWLAFALRHLSCSGPGLATLPRWPTPATAPPRWTR